MKKNEDYDITVENGQLFVVIRTAFYNFLLILGIICSIFIIIVPIIYNNFDIRILLLVGMIFFGILKASKKIKIYEKCVEIGREKINYENIKSFKFITREIKEVGKEFLSIIFDTLLGASVRKVNYLEVEYKDSGKIYILEIGGYSLKSLNLLTKYIEEYTDCDVQEAYKFLEIAKIKERKETIMISILMGVFIIGLIFFIKFFLYHK